MTTTLDTVNVQRAALARAAELIIQLIMSDGDQAYDEGVGLRRAAKLCRDLADELGPHIIEGP